MEKIDYYEEPEEEKVELYEPLTDYQQFMLNVDNLISSLRILSKKSTEIFVDLKDLKEEINDNKIIESNYQKYLLEYNRIKNEYKDLLVKYENY